MKINKIAISNFLSFEHKDHFEESDFIKFNDGLNCLIGPNGSGKSNFLELINQLLKSGFIMECFRFNEEFAAYETTKDPKRLSNVLRFTQQRQSTIPKNWDSENNDRRIEFQVGLSEEDIININFVHKNFNEIKRFFKIYSNIPNAIEVPPENLVVEKEYDFVLEYGLHGKNNLGISNIEDKSKRFIFQYFRWFNFIQNIIEIANSRHEKNWPFLKNTFALLNSNRSFDILEENVPTVIENDKIEKFMNELFEYSIKTSPQGEPIPIKFVKNKLMNECNEVELELSQRGLNTNGKKTIELIKSSIYQDLNKLLKKHLNFRLGFEKYSSKQYQFYFVDEIRKEKITMSDLSSGQKELLLFILTIYGFDLKSGMLIIDEPELHLHTLWQKKYLEIIKDAISNLTLQIIIATHSPIFVNEETIGNVIRFYKEKNFTKSAHPTEISLNLKNRIRLLTFTNSSSIFFYKKIVLVEGYPDRVFFSTYFDNYKKRKSITFDDIDFLDMGSKDEYDKWNPFLSEFKINSFYLADADNLKNAQISANSSTWNTLFPDTMLYRELMLTKTNNPTEYQNIINEIKSLYQNKIYLLKNGSLENYFLLIKNKNPSVEPKPTPDKIINFCSSDLDSWVSSNLSNSIVIELDEIFDEIMKS